MTVAAMAFGLLPVTWSTGTGSDVMKRIAAPIVGGLVTSFVLELLIYPAIYEVWRWNFGLRHELGTAADAEAIVVSGTPGSLGNQLSYR